MFRSLFEGHALINLPILTLLFFFGVFAAVVVWVVRSGPDAFRDVSRLPLDESAPTATTDGGSIHDRA